MIWKGILFDDAKCDDNQANTSPVFIDVIKLNDFRYLSDMYSIKIHV